MANLGECTQYDSLAAGVCSWSVFQLREHNEFYLQEKTLTMVQSSTFILKNFDNFCKFDQVKVCAIAARVTSES